MEQLKQTAWYLVNDCFRTDLVLCHTPGIVALACIHMAGLLLRLPTIRWLRQLDFSTSEVEQVVTSLVTMYDGCSRLKPKELEETHELLTQLHWAGDRRPRKAT